MSTPELMELAYVAHAARCALLLDADGICRWFLLKSEEPGVAAMAERCVGAQFVATLDPDVEGLLGHEPAVGKNVLFARVDDGRVTLVRFGPLVEFETLARPIEHRETRARVATASEPAPVDLPVDPTIEAAPATIQERRRTIVASPPPPAPSAAPISEPATSDDPNEDDATATSSFARAVVLRAARRGMLPRRG